MNIFQRFGAAFRLILKGEDGALTHRPDLYAREHLMTSVSNEISTSGTYSYLSAIADYGNYVWLKRAVKIVADNISSLPVQVEDANGELLPKHPVSVLLSEVNGVMSPSDLWQWWTVDMLLGGESFIELVRTANGNKRYTEMWPRQPHLVSVVPDAAAKRYYRVAGYTIKDDSGEYSLPPDECLHTKFYNPSNVWRGLSPVQAARSSITTDKLTATWAASFYANQARPDYVLMAPQGTTTTERDQLLEQVIARQGGSARAHLPMVLESGVVDLKTFSFPPKDLEWISQREMSRSEVSAVIGVPDEVMGYGRDTYENFGTALRMLWTVTLIPIARVRDTTFTEFFRRAGALSDAERIVTDYSNVPELQEDITGKLDQAQKLFAMGVGFNAVDEYLGLGVGPIPGGETGYLPAGLVPLSIMGASPEPEPAPEPAEESAKSKQVRRMNMPVEYGSPAHRAIWGAYIKRLTPHEKKFKAMVARLMNDLRAEVLERVEGAESTGKAATAAEVARNPFNRKAWIERFRKDARPLLRAIVQEYGDVAMDDVKPGISFELSDPEVTRFLQSREQRFAKEVVETTWQRLKDELSTGIANGESIPQLEGRVNASMDLRANQNAETIARTEVVGASNGGTLESWKQSDVVTGKQWLATLDDRVRESHEAAHGQVVGIGEEFEVGGVKGPAPGQIGEPGEDINCRCTMIPVLRGD